MKRKGSLNARDLIKVSKERRGREVERETHAASKAEDVNSQEKRNVWSKSYSRGAA